MNPAARWFLLILALTIAAPYLLGVKPRTRRHWLYVVVTIAFLAWVLPLMVSLRALRVSQDGLPLFRKMQDALGGACFAVGLELVATRTSARRAR